MQIDVRATERLRAKNPVDLGAILSCVLPAVRDSDIDLTRLRIVCDWVQYRQNFRNVVDLRNIIPPELQARDGVDVHELAIDMRRASTDEALTERVAKTLSRMDTVSSGNQYLEDWTPESSSVIWDFNSLYWGSLGHWEAATGKQYEEALPGGESDARNAAMAREMIEGLFEVWDQLLERKALPEDLYVLELGVGNGNQAKVWLDEFVKVEQERKTDYYRRLHYLLADYSAHVVEPAETVKEHAPRCSSLVMDARVPTQTLGFLRGKAFLIYISNVYDNLPTDEVVRIGGQTYLVEVRAYVEGSQAREIAESIGIAPEELPALTRRLLQLGPDLLAQAATDRFPGGVNDAVAFWQKVWDATRLEERYVAMESGLDTYQVANGIRGEALRPILNAIGDVRMQVSNGAAASFMDSLPLLHPFGTLQCFDIFVTDASAYERSFRGPGKYDGSVVNWVNGSLLAAIGRRNGYEVSFDAFQHRAGSNITTLTARVQE